MLEAALRASGEEVRENSKRFHDFAEQIQATTPHSNEAALEAMRMAKNFGLAANEVEGATQMAVGLSEIMARGGQAMDLASTMRYTAMAMQGETMMLRRYIPELRNAADAEEELAIIKAKAAQGLQLAQERTDGLRGSTTQMRNELGDAAKMIGAELEPALRAVISRISAFAKWFQDASPAVRRVTVRIGALVAAIGPLMLVTAKWIQLRAHLSMIKMATATNTATVATTKLALAQGVLAKGVAAVGVAWAGWNIGKWIGEIDAVQDALHGVITRFEWLHNLATAGIPRVDRETEAQWAGFDEAAHRHRERLRTGAMTREEFEEAMRGLREEQARRVEPSPAPA